MGKRATQQADSEELLSLLRRQAALRESIAKTRLDQNKKRAKEAARLSQIVGTALTTHANASADFKLMLKQVLHSAEMREPDRAFLVEKGWL